MSNFNGDRLAAGFRTHRIPELDGLRAVAILLVIGCHYPAFSSTLHGLPEYGWVGVEIFFVLSGFLITSILLAQKDTRNAYLPFLKRRAVRIMPPYFLVLLLIVVLFWATDRKQISSALLVLWTNIFFWFSMQDNLRYFERTLKVLSGTSHPLPLFARSTLTPNLSGVTSFDFRTSVGHFWSVSVEEWYYVLWAPVVLILRRSSVAIAGIFLIIFAFLIRWLGFHDWEWYVNFLCRCDMLAVGGLLALWMERRSSVPQGKQLLSDRLLRWASAGSAACLGLLLLHLWPFLGKDIRGSVSFAAFGPLLISLTVAGVLAIVLNESLSNNPLCRVLRSTPLVYVGRRSYMIYLVHVPVYILFARIFSLSSDAPGIRLWMVAVTSVGFTLVFAALSWRFFESPILSLRDKDPQRRLADPAISNTVKS